uniref:Rho GTPase-activating protein 29 n=1 Tax=Oryzias latipes TaxID=8090 RepID=A0A3P9K155_ORYLA
MIPRSRSVSSAGGSPGNTASEPRSVGSTTTWAAGGGGRNPNPQDSMGASSLLTGASGLDPDYVMQLVSDVRGFAGMLVSLKGAFQHEENMKDLQELVQERLAELFRALKAVIGKHRTLNSVDVLGAAGTVMAKVKGVKFSEVTFEDQSAVFREIHAAIDTLAFTFGNVVSDFLMGDVDRASGLGGPQTRRSRSFDDLSADPDRRHKRDGGGPDLQLSREEEVDLTLLRNEVGVESALLYAKAWSKHIKDLLLWMEKRVSMDIEYAKNYSKIAESAKVLASQQDFMPFSDIYISTFKKDIEHNTLLLQTALALQSNKFIQPLLARKNELDKLRKDLKEQWQREQRKMHEANAALRKAQTLAEQRREEYKKVLSSSSRSQEEQGNPGNKQLERRRRLEEEALQKAEEAQDQYQSCRADAGVRRMDLANAKRTVLTQLRETIFQCDLTLKAVTVNWLQIQQAQTVVAPAHYQALNENAKLYEPGECYAEFVRNLPRNLPKEHLHSVSCEGSRFGFNKRFLSSSHSSQGNLSQTSTTVCDEGDLLHPQPVKMGGEKSSSSTDLPDVSAASRNQAQRKAWASSSQVSQGGVCSDSESAGGSSESRSIDSPTASPGDLRRRLPRTPSTGTMSSADDLDDREPLSPLDNGPAELVTSSSPGPFRNAQMSKAAQTHRLRKLRAPSKCRECDGLVVFHGAECEECSLACHKKCLETLAIQCGHRKLPGKLQLFGVDFALAAKSSLDGIPFIIRKCASEIESRALNVKGIYRVNGAKSRVEKLCQAFENGKDLVELSEHSPHDISNVLKLYLRQLPEPLILHRFYNDFIGLAKESQRASKEGGGRNQRGQHAGEGPGPHMKKVFSRVRELLNQLPVSNFRTLCFLTAHLNRVAEHAEENKMTVSNLGIIFGPTLVKPQQTDAEVSLSSLVDYPYQVLMVELLVRHFHLVFDNPPPQGSETARNSPRLTPQQKVRQLSKHSTSLTDIKENPKVFKRFSSVIPSTHILDEVQEVEPGKDQTEVSAQSNEGPTSPAGDVQRSALMFQGPPSMAVQQKIQLRPQRGRQASRPISMPLARNHRNVTGEGCERDAPPLSIQEEPEPERARPCTSSRVSSYYISPFIDTQTMPRKTWDRKYKHYDVTPRTAMIIANLPPPHSGTQPITTALSAGRGGAAASETPPSPVVPFSVAKRDSPSPMLTLRAPRTLQPPPGTFYKPLPSSTLINGGAPVAPPTSPPHPEPSLPVTSSTAPVSPKQAPLPTHVSSDGASPPPPAPSSPSDCKPVQQRLRPRRLQELEHRESHFV